MLIRNLLEILTFASLTMLHARVAMSKLHTGIRMALLLTMMETGTMIAMIQKTFRDILKKELPLMSIMET